MTYHNRTLERRCEQTRDAFGLLRLALGDRGNERLARLLQSSLRLLGRHDHQGLLGTLGGGLLRDGKVQIGRAHV